jgi:hypothetical protein
VNLPSPEICQHILALYVLLCDGNDERRLELLQFLLDHGWNWNSLPELFAAMKLTTATPLPAVDSGAWRKRCEKLCHMHAAMGSSDNYGATAYKKFISERAKQQFNSIDIPAILAADWIHRNPPSTASQSAASTPDFTAFDFVLALVEDHLVMMPAQRMVYALWAFHCLVYTEFEYTPRLGVISPDSGYGKTRAFRLLNQLIAGSKLSKNTTAAGVYRRLERRPRMTVLLDEAENQPILTDAVMRSLIDGGYERGGTFDRSDVEVPVFFPCAYAVRGLEYDVPRSIRTRSFLLHMTKGIPRTRFNQQDPAFVLARQLIEEWKATVLLNLDPEIPAILKRDSRVEDNCRPLLAVADSFEVGEAARAALIELLADTLDQGPAYRVLAASKAVCDTLGEGVDRIGKKPLTKAVIEHDEFFSDWRGINDRGQPHELTTSELSRLLKHYKLRSRTLWPTPRLPNSKSYSGYLVAEIVAAWREHCSEDATATQPNKIIALGKS